jgi:4-hydroxybenzoate polyprenyltransferase
MKLTAFKAYANLLGAINKTIRLPSTLGFASAAFAGVVLSGSPLGLRVIWLLIFSVSSAAFGFVTNDLLDADLDRSAGISRNPISTGQLSRRGSIIAALLFLLVSLAALPSRARQRRSTCWEVEEYYRILFGVGPGER